MLDDPTGVQERSKQESLDFILHNINQMYDYGVESDVISRDVRGISLEDIDRYMRKIDVDQDSPIKLLTINSVDIAEPVYTNDLVDYFQTYLLAPVSFQRVYIIEGGSFALVMIPIQMEKDKIQIILQPLESSLPYIQDEYKKIAERRDSKGRIDLEELKRKIPLVKFTKKK